jgi:hypothetical protein
LSAPALAAIAAALIVGVIVGRLSEGDTASMLREGPDGVRASAGLARALETQLSGAPEQEDVRVLATYRGANGGYCRWFDMPSVSGLACRDEAGWSVRALDIAPERIEALTESPPLEPETERRARDSGWRENGGTR